MSEKPKATHAGGYALVRRHFEKFGKTTSKSDVTLTGKDDDLLKVRLFESTPAKVGLTVGGTFPTPVDYEFARVDVTLELPTYPEEKDACFLAMKKWVHSRFKRELMELEIIEDPATKAKAVEASDDEPPKKKIKKLKKKSQGES